MGVLYTLGCREGLTGGVTSGLAALTGSERPAVPTLTPACTCSGGASIGGGEAAGCWGINVGDGAGS